MIPMPTHRTAGSHDLIPPARLYSQLFYWTLTMGQVLWPYLFHFILTPGVGGRCFGHSLLHRGTQDSEKPSGLAEVTQLVNGRVRIRARLPLVPAPALFLLCLR